ncbi:hypothetical protein JYU34_008581 [Plutella xylostella]|uniref:Methyltransferase domain-containing protein n=1 Tax=Plutella xylostella TaxID=51655 RepID=A0ABQ7QL98_PLUXY|nr:hypothetical protein JYU34_008581 [Plutella xylostella]
MKAVMNEAELYHKSNSLQRRDALNCLDEYADRIKWRSEGDRVIDIGCGDGSVTAEVVRARMGRGRLVGCDLSEQMVKYAAQHHRDARTSFCVLDIEGDLPEEHRGVYHHAFSFYTLHWIHQQEKAFTNIFDLLAPGGDCLLIFLGHMPMFDVYRVLSTSPKWSRWLADVEKYISPYHDSLEPEKDIAQMMKRIGFREVEVQYKDSTFIYDKLEILRKAVMAVNPFSIPKDLQDSFMDDYLDVVRDLRLMDEANNNVDSVSIRTHYSLIVAYGTK